MNRKGIPIEMKETKDREEFSWIPCKEDNGPVILNSYVVKTKSTGKKEHFTVTNHKRYSLCHKRCEKKANDVQAI